MKYGILKDTYTSPRISGEFLDCSMPMTLDQYSNCGFNCIYCFSSFQRSLGNTKDNYLAKKVKKISLKKFKWYFENLDAPNNHFAAFIKNRVTIQWGGLSDPLCPIEEQEELGYEMLVYLKKIKYPICFSSKSDLLLRDKKYLELFEGMGKYWSYKASIITLDEEKARVIEAGVPTPQRRIETLKVLGDMGIWTIWRLRPFIIGLTDLDYEEQLKIAADIGVKAISTEFFCVEIRSINLAKAKYKIISDIIGYDLIQFYKNISNRSGYMRLNRKIKEPYLKRMDELCTKYGLNFHVSDNDGKEYGCSGSCCGLPESMLTNFSKCQFTNAIKICKEKGEVTWDDIAKDDVWLKTLTPMNAPSFNSTGDYRRQKKCQMTMYQYMKNAWNNPKDNASPYKYFNGVMFPKYLDKNKNIVYKYKPYKE